MQMIIRLCEFRAKRTSPHRRNHSARDLGKSCNALLRIQICVANPVHVRCRSPAVRRCAAHARVPRRAVAPIRPDVDIRPHRIPEELQRQRKEYRGARYVPRKDTQWWCLAHVRMDELGSGEMRRKTGLARLRPRLDLVEVARKHTRLPGVIAEDPAGHQHVTVAPLQASPVHETQRKGRECGRHQSRSPMSAAYAR